MIISVFPGQGSQAVGMGSDLADNFPVARELFEQVDDVLGQPLSKLMREGPIEELSLTVNAQPALVACSCAAAAVLEHDFGWNLAERTSFGAGHSLGEYSALAAMGVISVATAVSLVRFRGEAMQRAVPAGKGAMVAVIGLSIEQARELVTLAAGETDGVCTVANDNAPSQQVISGDVRSVEEFRRLATEAGAKKIIGLNVSAPFHCSLMQPAADEMSQLLLDTGFSAPIKPIITNVSAQPHHDSETLREHLCAQVAGGVRWRESMLNACDLGVTSVIEVGSGKVLSGLAKRINRNLSVVSASDASSIEGVVSSFS